MRSVNLVYRVFARVGEARADARVLERRFEQLLAQAAAVGLPVLDLAALPEGDGVVLLAALREFRSPYAADAGRNRVVDETLVVDHRERVAFLDAEEIHRPLVDVLHLRGQRVGEVVFHDRAPERGVDDGALLGAPQRVGFRILAHGDRIVVVEPEDDVLRRGYFVGEVVQVRGVERILVDEGRVFLSGPDAAQREDILRLPVQQVDRAGRNAVASQDFPQRLSRTHFARFGAVFFGVDAVEQVLGGGLLLRGFRVRFRFGRSVPAAGARRSQQQGADRDSQISHSTCKFRQKTRIREFSSPFSDRSVRFAGVRLVFPEKGVTFEKFISKPE